MTQLALIPDPPATGKQLRDRGIKKVSANNDAFLETCRTFARNHCKLFGSCTSDEVRRFVEYEGLKPTSPNAYGAIFRNGEFEPIGWKESEIESNHARPLRIWRLKQS